MITRTVKAELIASETDPMDYTTYVFKLADPTDVLQIGFKYIMCTRWPNWEHRQLKQGEVGFLNYSEIEAGKDTWFDGKDLIPYRYDSVQFNKFVAEQHVICNKTFKL